jgi:hypothetical protein
MNRRTTIKALLGIGGIGILASIFPIYKYIKVNEVVAKNAFGLRRDLIAELADVIIPATETPGAKQANVQDFIVNVLTNCTKIEEQNIFLQGLNDVENYCQDNHYQNFMKCDALQKQAVLKHFEERDLYSIKILNKVHDKFLGQSFYQKLRMLTINGYCNSMLGATQGLAYDAIPGQFEACVLLKPLQKSWATK